MVIYFIQPNRNDANDLLTTKMYNRHSRETVLHSDWKEQSISPPAILQFHHANVEMPLLYVFISI